MNRLKKIAIVLACFLNRRLRYGNSTSRLLQFAVIRSRTCLKRFISYALDDVKKMGAVTITLKHAGKLRLYPNDYIDRWLYTGADFEPMVVKTLTRYLTKNDNFLDIGANIGYFTLIASRLIGKGGTVYAFEPTPSTLEKLKANISMNGLANVRVFDKAISNRIGTATFKTPVGVDINSGRSSFRDIEEEYASLEVEMITLDSILPELKKIKVLKMDIEGAEGLAMEGMVNLLERDRPLIIMELSDDYLKQLRYSAESVLNFLKDRSYKIFWIQEPICAFTTDLPLPGQQYDILCIPAEQLQKTII
jgi:FkbM family methyltransferase